MALLAIGFYGCVKPDQIAAPRPAGASGPATALAPARGSKFHRPDEDFFVALTKEEPALVGYFLDSNKRIVAYVTDSSRFQTARAALERHRSRDGLHLSEVERHGQIVIRKADYSFQQLSDWRDAVTESILTLPGVVFDDLDEAQNRVAIGVTSDPAVRANVSEALSQLGIPKEAVVFEATEPVKPTTRVPIPFVATQSRMLGMPANLSDIADVLGGGLMMVQGTLAECTLGLIVEKGSGAVPGALTVSHCSPRMLGLDSATFGQPYSSLLFGTESADPSGTRYSDASFVILDHQSTKPGRRGTIYRPLPSGRTSGATGSKVIDSLNPYINITGGSSTLVSGTTVDKIGHTSGWTYGNIDRTCSDQIELSNGSQYVIHCSYRSSTYVEGGDSGSPVFKWDGGIGAEFAGMTWGGSPSIGMWFSSYNDLLTDFGFLEVHSVVTLTDPSVSGSVSSGMPSISWTTSVSNSSSATTYKIYRTSWDASLGSYLDNDNLIYSGTSTSLTDSGGYVPVSSFNGTSFPGSCPYSWVSYRIFAYNAGITSQTIVYFLGSAASICP